MSDSQRLQELEDREAIRTVFVNYAKYLDSGDHAGYASLFAPDGVLEAQLGAAVGPAAIQALLDANLGPQVRGHLPVSTHIVSNQQIDIEGDAATTVVIWFYLTVDPTGATVVLQSGRYDDDLVRVEGHWFIKRHSISRTTGRSPMDVPPELTLSTLATRVALLEDREAIWRLFMTYKNHLDRCDFRAYASLFCEDAVWAGNLGKAVGPGEIEALLVRTMEVHEDYRRRTYHLVMNPVIEVDGDTATALSSWGFVTRNENDAPVLQMLGRYVDELRRTDGGWKFSRRVAYSDVPFISLDGII